MATQVVMPKLSPTMEEGQPSRWLKKEGDKVSMGEPLAEIDTDKATMEMQALSNGVLRKILIKEGESAPLGQPIAIIGEPEEDISSLLAAAQTKASESPSPQPAPEESKQTEPAAATSQVSETSAAVQPSDDSGRQLISPIAARMAADAGINLKSLQGSGPGGRIVKRDVEAAMTSTPKAGPRLAPLPKAGEK